MSTSHKKNLKNRKLDWSSKARSILTLRGLGTSESDTDSDSNDEVGPTEDDVEIVDGIWQHAYRLHQLDSEKYKKSNYKSLKEMTLRDYDTWIVASALMGTAGLGAMFDLDITENYHGIFFADKYKFLWDFFCRLESEIYSLSIDPTPVCSLSTDYLTRDMLDFIAILGFIVCMTMSVYTGFLCFFHYVGTHGYYNMIPASQFAQARAHQRDAFEKYRVEHKNSMFIHVSESLGYGADAFFNSFRFLLWGISFGTWVKFGPIFSLVPCIAGNLMVSHLKTIHEIKHWGEHALPAFAKEMKNRNDKQTEELDETINGKSESFQSGSS